MSELKAVIFDFDGLIIDTETVWFECYKEVLARYQVNFTIEMFAPFIGTEGNVFHESLAQQVGEQVKIDVVRRLVGDLHREKMKQVSPRGGVRNYLEEAKEMGLKIGLASSSDREWVEGFLRRLELLPYFSVMKTEEDVQHVKPDPELYLQAIEALGLRADQAFAFEDSVNGLKAAKAAGLICVIVPNPSTEGLVFEDYDLRIRSMADQSLAELLKKLQYE
ncbi:HAD family hydrolase [Ammoniphilus sp. YIM 78166]|uniref:HAD family hydrolase n=1 Tax=Ammoniphilus sp. YIM 78166 TaxID=1644106 RepID=UPI0010704A3D|nr:HAD family hydrolase [Ammoniphilus sp. YIM 78166]